MVWKTNYANVSVQTVYVPLVYVTHNIQGVILPAAPAVAVLALPLLGAPGVEILPAVSLHTARTAAKLASSRLKQRAQLERYDSP
jgi:hypothetical protein